MEAAGNELLEAADDVVAVVSYEREEVKLCTELGEAVVPVTNPELIPVAVPLTPEVADSPWWNRE